MVLRGPWDNNRIFKNCLNQNLVIETLLENSFEAFMGSKTKLWAFENSIFLCFANFWLTKLKPFSRKVRQSLKNYLTQNLVIGIFLDNGFEATLRSKTMVLRVWKEHFLVSYKFLIDVVETIFWESEAKHQNLFKSKFGHRKLLILRKWFWSYLEL